MKKGVDYIGVGVGAVIFNASGKIFLAKRGYEARNERHKWEFPGGAVEFGESLEKALVREVREEYGLRIEVERLLDVVNHLIPEERQHWVSPTFICRTMSDTAVIREPRKCEAIGWFEREEIPVAELTSASKKSLESLERHEKNRTAMNAQPLNAILLLGPTGSGKSPLGEVIGRKGFLDFECRHLDFGSELREALSLPERSMMYDHEELDFIRGVLDQGLLLENEHFLLAEKIIRLFLERKAFTRKNLLVLNGIPRHAGQADDISRIARIHALIVLDCKVDAVFARIRNNTGGDRDGRIDDKRNLIEKKLDIFRDKTAPLVSFYEKRGATVYRVPVTGTMSPDDVYCRLSLFAAANPPVALVAEPPER